MDIYIVCVSHSDILVEHLMSTFVVITGMFSTIFWSVAVGSGVHSNTRALVRCWVMRSGVQSVFHFILKVSTAQDLCSVLPL